MDENELKTEEQTEVQAEPAEAPEEPSAPAVSDAADTNEAEETDGTAEPEKEAEAEKVDWFGEVTEILEVMLRTVFVILLLFAYLMRPVTVEGRSMVPTLYNDDKLVMYRLFYQPKAGDVVVVNNHGGHIFAGDRVVDSGASLDECIIKRVIAVGGEKIDIDTDGGRVYVNDVLLDEPYINELTLTNDRAFEYPITIPEGYVFVMGDNRNHSSDSRSLYVGLVDVHDVMGTAFFRYQPAKDAETGQKLGTIGFIR